MLQALERLGLPEQSRPGLIFVERHFDHDWVVHIVRAKGKKRLARGSGSQFPLHQPAALDEVGDGG